MKKCSSCKPKKRPDTLLRSLRKEGNKSSKSNKMRLLESRSRKLSKKPSGEELRSLPAEKWRPSANKRRMRPRGSMNLK